jgi:ubiquinone/menaquinone biosynthesis C-methylase UbiE
VNFSKRSYTKELLDRDDITFDDIKRNMDELDFINTYLGGHNITIDGLKRLINKNEEKPRRLVIAEIGCGGGDNLKAIEKWFNRKDSRVSLVGIDINSSCIELAKTKLNDTNHRFICSDYKLVTFPDEKPDIIFSSLFCHHFTDEQLAEMMIWMKVNSGVGFFINDLHRHPLAYYSIKLLVNLFSRSYMVKNDAPLSVLRGFKKKDWKKILATAEIKDYSLTWKWAFRHLLTVRLN